MINKNILLASFIFPERVDWFLDYLENKFSIPKNKVFVFENLDDPSKVIITFKFVVTENKRVNLKSLFPNAILIHKKGTCIYTINALNKLIEEMSESEQGNIDHKSVKINWSDYQDKILLMNDNMLKISNIKRLF